MATVESLYSDASPCSRSQWLAYQREGIQNLIDDIILRANSLDGIHPDIYQSLKDRAAPFLSLADPSFSNVKGELLKTLEMAKTHLTPS